MLAKNVQSEFNHEGTSNQPESTDISTNNWAALCKLHQRQRKTKDLSQVRGDWAAVTTKCFVILNWIRHKKSGISVSFEGRLTNFNYFGLKQNLSNPLVIVKATSTKQSMTLHNFFFWPGY